MRSFKPLHFFSGEKNYKLGLADLTDRPKIYRAQIWWSVNPLWLIANHGISWRLARWFNNRVLPSKLTYCFEAIGFLRTTSISV